jgi:hypothetical protein
MLWPPNNRYLSGYGIASECGISCARTRELTMRFLQAYADNSREPQGSVSLYINLPGTLSKAATIADQQLAEAGLATDRALGIRSYSLSSTKWPRGQSPENWQ